MSEMMIDRDGPLVSIIIPVYNKAAYVRETLESALGQTYPNIEIVLVNDGSTDGSLAILEEFKSRYSDKIILIDQENGGVSKATNIGIQASRGDYIQFLDADDLLSPDKIALQINLLRGKSPLILSSCEWVNFKDDIKNYSRIPYGVFKDFDSGLEWLLYSWNYMEMMADSSWLTSKKLIDLAGNWNESLLINQDGEFFMRVLLKCKGVRFDSVSKVFYRNLTEESVSRQKTYHANRSLLDSFKSYQKEILQLVDSKKIRIALKRVYLKFIYDTYPHYPDLINEAKVLIDLLGVSEATPIGGPKFRLMSRIFGFEKALWLKRKVG
jgi:glycosyltransferase involved in cell wall biosynthesis